MNDKEDRERQWAERFVLWLAVGIVGGALLLTLLFQLFG